MPTWWWAPHHEHLDQFMAILFAQHLELGLGLQEQGKGGQEARVSEQGTGGRGKGFRSKAQGHRVPEQGTGGQVLKVRRRGGSVPPPSPPPPPLSSPLPCCPSPDGAAARHQRQVLPAPLPPSPLHRCLQGACPQPPPPQPRPAAAPAPALAPAPCPQPPGGWRGTRSHTAASHAASARQKQASLGGHGGQVGREGGGGGQAVEAPAATACTPARYSLSTRPHQHTQLRT